MKNENLNGKTFENEEDYFNEEGKVLCRVCGEYYGRLYGEHFKRHKITTKEYREMYPGAPITTKKDAQNTSKNSGKHMQTEKYKKMFSEKFSGENNPMHRSKRTEQERKENSPFSIEFYKKRYPNNTEEEWNQMLEDHRNSAFDGRVLTTNIEYYLNQGMTQEEAEQALTERQTTFSKETCIEKYGEEEGVKIWLERQDKWQDSLNKNGNLKMGYSNTSQELFGILKGYIGENCSYATHKGEFKLRKSNNNGIWLYDFRFNDKLIEYQGDMYHANPKKYESNDTPHPFRKNITSEEIWKKDALKKDDAIANGYDVLYIWDSEFRKVGKELESQTIKRCLNFLSGSLDQEMYQTIWSVIKHKISDVYFATLNENKEIDESGRNYEYRLRLNKSYILPDFYIPSLKLIIEFDGTYYHRPTPENKKREAERDRNIMESGYKVLHISEHDYKLDKKGEVQKCLNFIKENAVIENNVKL